ncbi:U-box domain-containing protein 19 [Prunus yedoensis var. nudiflora]|uniref:RING-type E3 ubiquitin transferase n=1 Tax=Prunus yedoensis var. nudiflora TaxID=2094558 RepID=A0A314YI87_PRUYE|nr:U-box domain-containing protein 19 [Prunus yedoensis var. nudiflora]
MSLLPHQFYVQKQSSSVLSHTIASMAQKFDSCDRRILTLPAVRPCESISPETLLGSLIPLSRNICNFQSKHFATQRRNSREIIRQVSILLMFFEEIHDCNSVLSRSAILCLSELHLSFQKILFLLEDCTRDGARIWMLTKCEFLASHFRMIIRALATALDVLPLSLIDVDFEIKELVELVSKQSRKAEFEPDPDDKLASKRLLAILNQFEKGIEPDLNGVKRVLDYLQIKSWSECNMEIKFLEEEIAFSESSNCDEREVPFLSSLVGFMSYSRGVIFEVLDDQNSASRVDARCGMETHFSCLNPEDFRCPISLELMLDPVTVSTGQTYDRSSIQKWLKAGNKLCPKTGERLTSTELVPNSILRKVIKKFYANNGISLSKSGRQSRDISRTAAPGSPAAAEAMKFLSRFLSSRLAFGTNQQKNKAAYEIRLLAKSNIFNRSCLIKAGSVPPLLKLLCSTDAPTQENAIAALLKLSKYASGKKLIMARGGLPSVLAVLEHGLSLEARQSAAATIFYISSVKEYRKVIGETPEAIPALVELIKEGTTCGKKNAVVAIFGLLLLPENQQKVLEAGTVPLLVERLASSENTEQLLNDTLAVLAMLAENVEGALAILHTTALHLITRILQTSSSQTAKEYCASTLLSLCINGGVEVVAVLAKDSSLMPRLFSLLTDGTAHASKKARSLIKIMHNFHETSSLRWMSSAAPRAQCIRER